MEEEGTDIAGGRRCGEAPRGRLQREQGTEAAEERWGERQGGGHQPGTSSLFLSVSRGDHTPEKRASPIIAAAAIAA